MNPWIKGFAIPHELIVNSSVSLMEGPHFFFFIIEILYCHTAQNYWLGSRQLNTCMAINFYYYPVCWVLNSLCPHFLNKKWPASSFGGGCPFFSGLHPTWENDWLITAQHSISLLTFFSWQITAPHRFLCWTVFILCGATIITVQWCSWLAKVPACCGRAQHWIVQ